MEDTRQRLPVEHPHSPGHYPAGPYYKDDKAQFTHASIGAQEWFLRLSKEDVELLEYSVRVGFWVRTGLKWGRWSAYAFTAGLSGALVVGEKLQKLSGMISDILSNLQGLF